ncbi:MAG: hypothetical protein MUE53_08405 [Chitinophagales bacterium]|jgi:hypothetical protein|nr:hypothetical protein [Chitinophagales bacterium]
MYIKQLNTFRPEVPENFQHEDKALIYFFERPISTDEFLDFSHLFVNFLQDWKAHQKPVTTYAQIVANQVVVLLVKDNTISGCALDALSHFMKGLTHDFPLNLSQRFIPVLHNQVIQLKPFSEISEIPKDAMVLSNFYWHIGDLVTNFIQPLAVSKFKNLMTNIKNS